MHRMMLQTCNKRQTAPDLVEGKQQNIHNKLYRGLYIYIYIYKGILLCAVFIYRIKSISIRFIMFIPSTAQQLHTAIHNLTATSFFFFRPTSGRDSTKKNTKLAVSEMCYCKGKKRR